MCVFLLLLFISSTNPDIRVDCARESLLLFIAIEKAGTQQMSLITTSHRRQLYTLESQYNRQNTFLHLIKYAEKHHSELIENVKVILDAHNNLLDSSNRYSLSLTLQFICF